MVCYGKYFENSYYCNDVCPYLTGCKRLWKKEEKTLNRNIEEIERILEEKNIWKEI